MDTAHFWIPKSFPVQNPFLIRTYAQARGIPEFPETFSIAFDHAKVVKKGLNLFKTISSLFWKSVISSLWKILNQTMIHDYLRIVKIIDIRKTIEFYSHKNCIKCSRLTSSSFVTLQMNRRGQHIF